jgi:hypothetical protein
MVEIFRYSAELTDSQSSEWKTASQQTHAIEVVPQCPYWLSASCTPYTESVVVQYTEVGPVISDLMGSMMESLIIRRSLNDVEAGRLNSDNHYEIALQSIAISNPVSIDYLYRWNTMHSWNEFVYGSKLLTSMSLAVAFSDDDHNVGYVITSKQAVNTREVCTEAKESNEHADGTEAHDGTKVCVATGNDPTEATRGASEAVLNPIPIGGAILFDDLAGGVISNNGAPRSVQLIQKLMSKFDGDSKDAQHLRSEFFRELAIAKADTYSESSMFLKDLILSISLRDQDTVGGKGGPLDARGHFLSESAEKLIEDAQFIVRDFDGHMQSGHRISQQTGSGLASDGYNSAVAATVIESFRQELMAAVFTSSLVEGLKGSIWSPIRHLRDNIR